jgi:hypothetical protein
MTRAARKKQLTRMSMQDLAAMCRRGVHRPDGGITVIEGAYPVEDWTREEIVTSILNAEFPDDAGAGIAGLTPSDDASPAQAKRVWQAARDRCSDPAFAPVLAGIAATPQGLAALAASRRTWAGYDLEPPWPSIVPVALADALPPGPAAPAVPDGTTASRCTGCGETRLSYPGDRTDEWKHHFDHCPRGDTITGGED